MTLEHLKQAIKEFGTTKALNEYLFASKPICFAKNEALVWEIRRRISEYFDIPTRNLEIVGSAKLGFSLSDERFGKPYNNSSDIDIVIVSPELFAQFWNDLLYFDNRYYSLSTEQRLNLEDSYSTVHKGYLSPDKLPKSERKEIWWKLFNELSNKPKFEYRKIRGRLFLSWKFVEKYYSIQFNKLNKID